MNYLQYIEELDAECQTFHLYTSQLTLSFILKYTHIIAWFIYSTNVNTNIFAFRVGLRLQTNIHKTCRRYIFPYIQL